MEAALEVPNNVQVFSALVPIHIGSIDSELVMRNIKISKYLQGGRTVMVSLELSTPGDPFSLHRRNIEPLEYETSFQQRQHLEFDFETFLVYLTIMLEDLKKKENLPNDSKFTGILKTVDSVEVDLIIFYETPMKQAEQLCIEFFKLPSKEMEEWVKSKMSGMEVEMLYLRQGNDHLSTRVKVLEDELSKEQVKCSGNLKENKANLEKQLASMAEIYEEKEKKLETCYNKKFTDYEDLVKKKMNDMELTAQCLHLKLKKENESLTESLRKANEKLDSVTRAKEESDKDITILKEKVTRYQLEMENRDRILSNKQSEHLEMLDYYVRLTSRMNSSLKNKQLDHERMRITCAQYEAAKKALEEALRKKTQEAAVNLQSCQLARSALTSLEKKFTFLMKNQEDALKSALHECESQLNAKTEECNKLICHIAKLEKSLKTAPKAEKASKDKASGSGHERTESAVDDYLESKFQPGAEY